MVVYSTARRTRAPVAGGKPAAAATNYRRPRFILVSKSVPFGVRAEQITWDGVARLSFPRRQALSGPQAGKSVLRTGSLEKE